MAAYPYTYDLKITFRELANEDNILKSCFYEEVLFKNPFNTGDKLRMEDKTEGYLKLSEPVTVDHEPGVCGRSIINADVKVLRNELPMIEKILKRYDTRDF